MMIANMVHVLRTTFLGTHAASTRERHLNVVQLLIGIKKKGPALLLQAIEKQSLQTGVMDLTARLIASAKIGVMSFRSIKRETKYNSA